MALGPACRGSTSARAADGEDGPDPRNHQIEPGARLAALRMSHAEVRRRLGGHRFKAHHRAVVKVDGEPGRSLEETYELACQKGGDCHGRLLAEPEVGIEFFRLGEITYFRHRYQRFQRFTEARDEARARIQRLWAVGEAVVELVRPRLRLTPDGEARVAGRPVSRYRVAPSDKRRVGRTEQGSRVWRNELTVTHLEGEVLLDRVAGVPLRLRIAYGIRVPKGKRKIEITGSLEAEIQEPGKDPEIEAPKDFDVATPRRREVLDEQRLLGDHRMNPGWFRGGGPYEARKRARKRRREALRRGRGQPEPRPATRPAARRPAPGSARRPVPSSARRPVPSSARRPAPGSARRPARPLARPTSRSARRARGPARPGPAGGGPAAQP